MFESGSFERGTINSGPEKGRSLRSYEEMLGFRKEDLIGKTVLDLGAGPGALFSKELKASGIDADVISFSPDFSDQKERDRLAPTMSERISKLLVLEKAEGVGGAVAGVAQQMPFKDGSFDKVLALFSVTTWAMGDYRIWLPEIVRTLKSGGEARMNLRNPKMEIVSRDLDAAQVEFRMRDELISFLDGMDGECSYEFTRSSLDDSKVLVITKNPFVDESVR